MAEDEVEAEEVDSTYPTKGIHNFSKEMEAIKEPSQEGGASTPNKVGERRHLRATIAAKSAIAKRSTDRIRFASPFGHNRNEDVCTK